MAKKSIDVGTLDRFIRESWAIEGMHPQWLPVEVTEAHNRFLALPAIGVADLQQFVSVIQPGAQLRDRPGLDVRVGDHLPPYGGPHIREMLDQHLWEILQDENTIRTFQAHCDYEKLHPFTDGNGRSGRAIWLWQHLRRGTYMGLGFLHQWYYESLA